MSFGSLSPSWQPWQSWLLRKGFTPHSDDAQELTSTSVSANQWRASPGSAAIEISVCHMSSGAPPPKGWHSHLDEVVLAAAAKPLNINPSLGLVPMEAQGIWHRHPLAAEERKQNPPWGFVGPLCRILPNSPAVVSQACKWKKCEVAGVTAQLRGDCKSILRKGELPAPHHRRDKGRPGVRRSQQSSLSIPAEGEATECQ